jgi:hypothetical protein
MSNVWRTLSAIDCSKHVEKKGQLSYLSWAWAWGVMMEYYPSASYEFHAVEREPDGTATVSVTVTVEGQSRYMWLPVMDNKNNAVKNPDARKISDAKMRCLVKCLAMFGLAHYLYAGEDLPQAAVEESELSEKEEYDALCNAHIDSLVCIRNALFENDYSTAKEAWGEIDSEVKMALWKAPSKGGWFTTEERAKMKSNEWSAA